MKDGCLEFAEALKSVKEQVNSNGKHPYPLIFFMESKWFDEPVALYVENLKSRASFLSSVKTREELRPVYTTCGF